MLSMETTRFPPDIINAAEDEVYNENEWSSLPSPSGEFSHTSIDNIDDYGSHAELRNEVDTTYPTLRYLRDIMDDED